MENQIVEQEKWKVDLSVQDRAEVGSYLDKSWQKAISYVEEKFPSQEGWKLESTPPQVHPDAEWEEGILFLQRGWTQGFQVFLHSEWEEENLENDHLPPSFAIQVDHYTRLEDRTLNITLSTFAILIVGLIIYCLFFFQGNLFLRMVALFKGLHFLLLAGLLIHFFVQMIAAKFGKFFGPSNLTDQELDEVGEKIFQIFQEKN